jgi:hypothetical protein
MKEVADLIADMVRAGIDPEIIGRTAAALSAREPVLVPDEQAERRRAADRERKRRRKSAESAASAEAVSPKKEIPPTPPKEKTTPSIFSFGSAREFTDFWSLFPNKVGRRDAERAFDKARQRVSFETIIAGLQRYASKADDRPWCNPATFLNQDRWEDQPATAPPRPPSTASPSPRNAGERAFLRLQAENGHDPTDTVSKRLEPGDGRRQIEGNGDAWPVAGAQGAFGGN